MRESLIEGLNTVDMQAVANEYTLSEFYYPTLFPLRYTDSLKWEQLEAEFGAPVAGDVISWDARAPRKRREIVGALKGNIAKIGVAREKTESEWNEYTRLKRLAAGSTDANVKNRILEWIWEDQEFCYTGVNAKLEYLAIQAASKGKVTLTAQNNQGIVTDANVDFLIPNANKSGVAIPITTANSASSLPITMIKTQVKMAQAKNKKLNFAFTTQAVVDAILGSAETLSFAAPLLVQALNLTSTPSLQSLNVALKGSGLPQFIVIESFITLEDKKGDRETVDPWEPGVILFSESATLGNTFHTDLADEFVTTTKSLKVKRNHVLIKRFAQEEPLVETCLAIANAFPVMANAKNKWLVDTANTSWSK